MEQMRKYQKTIRDVFDRIPYGTPLTAEYLHIHGYPSVEIHLSGRYTAERSLHFHKISKMLDDNFYDEVRQLDLFTISGNKIFFTNEDDAHLFRSLLLLI